LGVSPQVRQHLANSRIEFLKAIREVIDERIEQLSKPVQQGTKIQVE
jgi:ribosome-associated translation inhibitor RaiA